MSIFELIGMLTVGVLGLITLAVVVFMLWVYVIAPIQRIIVTAKFVISNPDLKTEEASKQTNTKVVLDMIKGEMFKARCDESSQGSHSNVLFGYEINSLGLIKFHIKRY